MRKRLLSLLCVTSLLLTLLPTSVFAADAITGTQPTVTSETKPEYTAPTAVEKLVYNGENQMLITAGTAPDGCTMQYKLDDGEYSPDLPTAKDAGTYTVYYKAVGNGTNGDSEEKSVEVTIAKREVTLTGITVEEKVYDNTTAATVTKPTGINGLLPGDEVQVLGTYTANFDDVNVGTNKAVTITGYQLDGKDNENYTIKTTVTAYGTITPAPLKLDQATAESRAYVKGDKSVEIDTVTFEGWKDSKVAVIGTDYTATGMMADDKVGDNKDVTVTVELKGDAAKNYRLENATTTTKVTITQADYKGTKETTGIAKFGTEGTVDLSALIVEGGKLGEVKAEDTNSVLDGELSMDGKTLKFKFKADAKKDQNAKVTVKVTSDNYKEYTITVTLKVTEKLVQAPLKYAGRKTVTYGDTLQLNVTGGSGEGAVTYTASFNGKLPTAVENGLLTTTTGTGVFLVRVDKAGDDTHEGTFVTFEITVTKAPLKIEVANKQIYVGEAVPDLKNPKEGTDYTVTGLVKPEDLKGNAVLKYQKDGKEVTKPDTSKPGVYDITLTGLTTATQIGQNKPHDNYEHTILPGKLTILAQPSGGGSTGGGSSGGGGGSSSSGKTDKPSASTGKTETTTKPDGTTVKTETRADGTKIQTVTGKDGSTATVKTDKNGKTEAKTKLSDKAIEDAKKKGEAVKAPVEVEATRNSSTAPTVSIELPKGAGETKVEIPVSNANSGTVAVLVHPDGTEEIVKNSLPTENGIQLTVNGGATVKIVDHSKDFADTQNHWAKDAIDFVSARGLVSGMTETTYAPDSSTTRAQLWTILARQNDADLSGGATWYENAQNWAKAKGISDGTDPDGAINRAQMVTMLWRAMGQPAAGSAASFTDVSTDSYYAQAVAWAVEHGITTGVGNGKFDPNATCTRGQIATFLYRSMK